MKLKNPYNLFDNYVVRTPLLPINFYFDLTKDNTIAPNNLKAKLNFSKIKESLYLASPTLFYRIEKWIEGEISDQSKSLRLELSILKYLSRMSSRCTPFGLFAGCAVGNFDYKTNIELDSENDRHTRLDMNYLVALSYVLAAKKNIRKQLLFYPNTSIYKIGDQLRYVEYQYIGGSRNHHITAVTDSPYLNTILNRASKGAKLKDLAQSIVTEEIDFDDAEVFVNEIVNSQLLISELEPSVSGDEFLEQLIETLKPLEKTKSVIALLERIKSELLKIDAKIGNPPNHYKRIHKQLNKLKVSFNEKFVFQTDMVTKTKTNTLDKDIQNSLKKGLAILNRLTMPYHQNTLLHQFKSAFYERYESREMPLSKVLDTEIGLGYKQLGNSSGINPLVDGLQFKPRENPYQKSSVEFTTFDKRIQKKLMQAYKNDDYTISLNDKDINDLPLQWNDLPDTMSFMVELLHLDGEQKIKMSSGGGSSAANLLGRFCHSDEAMHTYVKHIIATEKNMNKDMILAEILHLPEARVGNILMRPSLRDFEIPYLSKSIKDEKDQLNLDDLLISVKNNRLLLRSKKHNKEVHPHLTNAHNYSSNALPVYHFLCDLQNQNRRGGLMFSLPYFEAHFEFIPRVEFENIILYSAKWNLKKEHIAKLIQYKNETDKLLNEMETLKTTLKLPQYVLLINGDNELLINLNNTNSVKMFIKEVEKLPSFKIKEFLFTEDTVVKKNGKSYTNQVVVSFYNDEKLKTNTHG